MVAVAWAGQKVVVVVGMVARAVEWWWSAAAARGIRGVDRLDVPVRNGSGEARRARPRRSFRAWALWCAAHGCDKIGGLRGRGWLIDCGCWNEIGVHPMVSGALWVGLLVDC